MDRRIINSEEKLKRSFMNLMQNNDPAKITVKRLCMEAGLNRSTFYDRFGYLDKLIECIIEDCMHAVCEAIDYVGVSDFEEGVSKKDIRLYMDRFLSDKVLTQFSKSQQKEKYFYYIIEVQSRISMKSMPEAIDYYSAFFQNTGVVALLLEWLNNGRDASEEQIIEIIHRFSKSMQHMQN